MAKQNKLEKLDKISHAVDNELSDSYNYSSSELYDRWGRTGGGTSVNPTGTRSRDSRTGSRRWCRTTSTTQEHS